MDVSFAPIAQWHEVRACGLRGHEQSDGAGEPVNAWLFRSLTPLRRPGSRPSVVK